MTLRQKYALAGIVRICFGLLAIGAVCSQLAVHSNASLSIINFFSYFTNLSNIIAAVVLIWSGSYVLGRRRPLSPTLEMIRGAATVYMAVVGIVFSLLLRDVDLGLLQPWVNTVLHYVMPIAVVADWLLVPPRVKLPYASIKTWLVFPFIYLLYSLVRGVYTGFYAYPFINPTKQGYLGVIMYSILVLLCFMGASALVVQVSRRLRPRA